MPRRIGGSPDEQIAAHDQQDEPRDQLNINHMHPSFKIADPGPPLSSFPAIYLRNAPMPQPAGKKIRQAVA
jgi:hypothetical protein